MNAFNNFTALLLLSEDLPLFRKYWRCSGNEELMSIVGDVSAERVLLWILLLTQSNTCVRVFMRVVYFRHIKFEMKFRYDLVDVADVSLLHVACFKGRQQISLFLLETDPEFVHLKDAVSQ